MRLWRTWFMATALAPLALASLALAPLLMWLFACAAAAHDIPAAVRISAFLKPTGTKLELLMRVPMVGMREVDFPTRGPGYLDISKADGALHNAAKLWLIDNIDLFENGVKLPPPRIAAARVSLPSDRSFTSYDEAKAHVHGPRLADTLDLYWNQQFLDVLLEVSIQSEQSEFAIHPRLDRVALKVSTVLRILPPGRPARAFEFHGDPGLVRLDPRWHQAASRFALSGFWHILEGADHLLFLLCLVIPFRQFRPLAVIVTAFTVAHSISLAAAVAGFVPSGLWFPPLVETLIALSVFVMALENIIHADMGERWQRRWILAFAFGLVHGFGFSFALTETLQFAGDHLVTSLLAFNVGVEIGQLAALIAILPILTFLFRHVVEPRLGVIVLSVLVAHSAWHWMADRGGDLLKFPVPTIDAAFLAGAMRALMAAIVLIAVVWLASAPVRRWMGDDGRRSA
jgi:HupE / UreJ protein